MRALIIDDSRTMRTILSRIVTGLGYTVAQAGDGKQGLEQLRAAAPPDVVFVDWNMPEMNGYEFVCAMRADQAYATTKIVMVTTEAEMSFITRAVEAGADEYLMKPFTAEALTDKLRLLGLAGSA